MIQNRSLPVLKINPSFKTVAPPPLFRSFFWGGFECAAPTVAGNKRLDLLRDTKHDIYCQDDYRLIKELDICTVREGFAWHEIDKGKNRYDFSRYEPMLKAAAVEGIQQIWDLCHYDYPAEIDPFTDEFIHRFARYAQKAAKKIRQYTSNTIFIVPINEISFWAHMGGSIGVWGPHAITRGYALKNSW